MNVAWKFIAVLALLFSLAALVLQILQIQNDDKDNAIRQQVELAMQTREKHLLDKLGPAVDACREFRHLPDKPANSLEDVGVSMLDLIISSVPPPAADHSAKGP